MHKLPFKNNSHPLTIGVELELQLINLQSFNLIMEAEDFLRRLSKCTHTGEVKPELTKAMIEINSSIHSSYLSLLSELKILRDVISSEAYKTHIGVCGGGTHPFQKWKNQRIFHTERFDSVSEQYGYLAKQFTVFGQHIHISCMNGDDALYLSHAMARYVPHFIALSAASPFNQGVDTAFDCSRLTVVSAFPLSGTPPWMLSWDEFEEYYNQLLELGVIKSMKDFYWDVRPKPEYGTIELRICDTPLTVEKAAELAAYAQLLVQWLLINRQSLSKDIYLTYLVNRFRASRYGLNAVIIDPILKEHISLSEDILQTCEKIKSLASTFNSEQAINNIKQSVLMQQNGASWLRKSYADTCSLNDTVRAQAELWMESKL